MELFVQFVVAGGLALVAGLWAVRLLEAWTLPWGVGVGLVTLGVVGLAAGIERELDY